MAQYGAGEASKNIWGFDPTSIGGCVLWLDGADSNTMFSDSGATIQSNVGDSVAVWRDKSVSAGIVFSTITVPTGPFTATGGAVTLPLSSATGISIGTNVTIAGVTSTGSLTTLNGTYTVTNVSGNSITFPNSTAANSVTTAGTVTIAVNNAIGAIRSSTSVVATGATSTANQITYSVTISASQTVGLGMLVGNLVTTTGISPATFNVTNATISSITEVTAGSVYTIVVNSTRVGSNATATSGGLMTFTNANFPTRTATDRLSFSGSQYLALPNPSLLPTGATNSTRFVVARTTDSTRRQTIFNNGSNAGGGGHNLQYNLGGNSPAPSNTYFLTNAFPTPFSGSQTISDLHIITGQLNNLIQAGWHNGNPYPSNNNGDTQLLLSAAVNVGTAYSIIGADIIAPVSPFTTNLRGLTGEISEILVYNSTLSNTDRQNVEGYLAWKWGLQASLPTIHPYFNQIRPFSRSFSPTDLPNCIMWYDAADLRTMFTNTAGTTQVTGNGSRVRFWRDKSGSGNNLTSNADANSPTLTTSTNPQRFDLVFDGVNDYLSNTELVNNSNTYTKFLVFRRNSTTAAAFQRLFSYGTTTGDARVDDQTGFSIQSGSSSSLTSYLLYKSGTNPSFTIATDTYYVATILCTPLTMSLFLNGSLTAASPTTLPNTNFSGTTFRLGTNFTPLNNTAWPGFINEVISYNRQLSTYEFREVESYLAWKWGIRSSLPTTHPLYKYPTPSLTPFQPELQLYKQDFNPADVSPDIWFDVQDRSTIALDSDGRVTQWRNKGTSTRCSFLAIPAYASRSLNTTETQSNGIGLNGPLLTQCVTGSNGNTDYMDFSSGSFYVSSASISGTTMTITLGNTPVPLNVTGGTISAFSLATTSGTNTTNLATLYFPEQMIPPFAVDSTINVTGTTSSGTALNGNRVVTACTPFYVTFTLSGATAGSVTTQGTIESITTPNVAEVAYTSTSAKQPIMAGQTIATIASVTPSGLNGTTPTILTATPSRIRFLTNVATGTISSGGTMTSSIIPHNIPQNRQITVGFAPNSAYSNGSTTDNFFPIETMVEIGRTFTGRGTAYIVQSVPTVNTLTITVPAGLPAGALRLTGGRVDYGEILGSNASTTGGINNSNSLSSTGNSATSATVNFTRVPRLHTSIIEAGDTITISGAIPGNAAYNGTWYVTNANSGSVTFETSTTLANLASSSAGSISRTQFIMASGCFGIRSISVSGTTATLSYNNFGHPYANDANNTSQPFRVGHRIYIANTISSIEGNQGIFNGTFIVTSQSSDTGPTGTVAFTTSAPAGTTAGTGIICRGAGGTGDSGAFTTLTCTINPTDAVVTFAKQPIIPFVVGQQICIAGTVSSGTNINGIRTVTASTNNSVTFSVTSGTGTISTQGTISGGTLVVTGGTYSSPNLTLQFTPAIATAFPVGTWVTVYGVLPAANNGFWQVTTGGSTTSVVLTAPTGAGPITNATGNVAYSIQTSVGTMAPHGLSPGDVVMMSSHYNFIGSNYLSIAPIPYTVITTPTSYRFTILSRTGYYAGSTGAQGWNNTVGPVYTQANIQVVQFPIRGFCLENTRSQAAGGIFNSSNATLLYMGHHYMNSVRSGESPIGIGSVICTSNAVNGGASNGVGNFFTAYTFSSAPRYNINRNSLYIKPGGDPFYNAFPSLFSSDTNSFRPVVVVSNLTSSIVNDIQPQTFAMALNGWRFDREFLNSGNSGQRPVVVSNQTAIVTNATWSGSVATLTILMNSQVSYVNGNSITVQNVLPDGFNGTFTLTGTPTLTTITYALATNPGAYTAGTGTVSLNTSTSLLTNHLRIGAATSASNLLGITAFTNTGLFYSQGIGDIIAFNRILSFQERQLLEGWACQKYTCQTFLANNQAAVRVDSSFPITNVAYSGTGPYTYVVTFTTSNNALFSIRTSLTISGCTGTEVALNRQWWGVTASGISSSIATVTFISPTIVTSATNLSSSSVTSGRVSGTTTLNTFIHPYRANPAIIYPTLDLTQTYAQGLAAWFDAANSSTIGFSSGNSVNSWSSAGGNVSGLTLTKDTFANQPTIEYNIQNGLPGIKFIRGAVSSDTGNFPQSSNLTTVSPYSRNMNQFTTISSNNEYTNFMVIKFTVSPEDGHTAMVIVSANDRPYLLKGNLVQYRKSFSQEVVYSPVLLINTPYIITTIRRGSTGTVIAVGNGARNITTTSFGENVQITGAFTRVTMGGYGPNPADNNDAFEGYIHEFVGFRYALTDQAIFQIEGYLAWKWGLQGAPPVGSSPAVVSLPETHPYYKLRP